MAIPKEKQKVLKPFVGKSVTLGIRPEHIGIGKGKGSPMSALVEVVEPMGNEMFVHFNVDGAQIVARIRPSDIHAGEKREFTIDMLKVHFFDSITENVIK